MALDRFRIPLNPKQLIAQKALDDKKTLVIGFGGAKKGGKSVWGRGAILRRALMYPGTMHLITRRSYGEVNKNHLSELKRLCRRWGVKFRWDNQLNALFFPEYTYGGEPSGLYLGYCETISDAERYVGLNWLTIWHEECTQVPWEVLQYINNELVVEAHAARMGAVPKIIYTCNPVGISKRAVKTNVRDPGMKGKDRTVWIQANWEDNLPFKLANPKFAENLIKNNKQSPWLAKALLNGDWNADPDRFYPFDDDEESVTTHIQTHKVPYWAKWYEGLDAGWGSAAQSGAFAAIIFARWTDRHKTFNPYTEEWEQREHWHAVREVILFGTDPDVQAREVRAMEKSLAHDPNYMLHNIIRVCDPAADTESPKESQEATRTILDIWGKHGMGALPAMKRGKLTGLNIVRSLMRKGIFSVDPSCLKYIQELADAVHEKKANGEISSLTDPRQPDDAQDAGRYITTEVFELEYTAAPGSVWETDLYEEAEV